MSSHQSENVTDPDRTSLDTIADFRRLICPLDGEPLTQLGHTLRCPDGHSFDVARQGYVNLLPVQNKRSRDPGDSREMVAARRRFLNAGHYQLIADSVASAVLDTFSGTAIASCLDAGCGEGYYLRCLQQLIAAEGHCPAELMGIDISKWAVQAAAKSQPGGTWLVASNARLPVASSSVDTVLCMFGFPILEEFSRILKPQGTLVLVEAGPSHLVELRNIIYASTKDEHTSEKQFLVGFDRCERMLVKHKLLLNSASAIADLLVMTPHMYRANAQGRSAALALSKLTLTVDVSITCWRKTGDMVPGLT